MPNIPKKIHAIWVGGILDETGRDNLVAWKEANKTYEVNLWIDSSLYVGEKSKEFQELKGKAEEFQALKKNVNKFPELKNVKEYKELAKKAMEFQELNERLKEFQVLKDWAKDNKIVICDIARHPKSSDAIMRGRSDIYENMLDKKYYDDEIGGKYRNLAAASDILRSEILFREGGIYMDAKDIFPGKKLPKEIAAEYGFYYHIEEEGSVNNDILASIPGGTLISKYREVIDENYRNLYQNEKKLKAHRNPEFTSPDLYGGINPRKKSTMEVSGPAALDAMTMSFMQVNKNIPEANKPIREEKELSFNKNYFTMPAEQAASWHDPQASSKPEKVVPILRNYIREYFNTVIDEEVSKINKLLNQQGHNKAFFEKDLNSIQGQKKLLNLLLELKQKLNALSPEEKMSKIYALCVTGLAQSDIAKLNRSGLLTSLKNCSASVEVLADLCAKNDIDVKDIAESLINMSGKYKTYNLKDFVKDVLDTPSGKPELEKLRDYGIKPPAISPSPTMR